MAESTIAMISVDEIKEGPVALRTVDTSSEKFQGLVDSIKINGLENSISVRKEGDQYMLIDGLHRLYACRQAGLEMIPCLVKDISESEVLAAQIMANVHKIETKPVEYSAQLRKILSMNRTMTISELAGQLAKSTQWVNERLGLLKLCDRAKELVDGNKITLTNAYALAKLPFEEQEEWTDRAQTLAPNEFVNQAAARVADIKKAKRQGKESAPAEFQAVARMRKLGEIKEAVHNTQLAASVCEAEGVEDAPSAFLAGVKWCLNLDTASIDAAKAKWEAHQAKKTEEAEKRRVERLQKQAEEAKAKLAKELTPE